MGFTAVSRENGPMDRFFGVESDAKPELFVLGRSHSVFGGGQGKPTKKTIHGSLETEAMNSWEE